MAGQPTQETVENDMYACSVERTSTLLLIQCTRAYHNRPPQQNLSPTERALYAALAPSPQTSGPLKAACRTWADQLWAIVSIACEERLTVGLANLTRESFWEGGLAAVEAPDPEQAAETNGNESRMETEEEDWEKEVLSALDSLSSIVVEEGYGVSCIIGARADDGSTGRMRATHSTSRSCTSSWAGQTSSWRRSRVACSRESTTHHYLSRCPQYNTRSPLTCWPHRYASMTRFFAHLCLYFQMIDVDVPPLAMQIILEAYLQVLEVRD